MTAWPSLKRPAKASPIISISKLSAPRWPVTPCRQAFCAISAVLIVLLDQQVNPAPKILAVIEPPLIFGRGYEFSGFIFGEGFIRMACFVAWHLDTPHEPHRLRPSRIELTATRFQRTCRRVGGCYLSGIDLWRWVAIIERPLLRSPTYHLENG
jgi:hypothetical protein